MGTISVRGKAAGETKADLTAGDKVQNAGGRDGSQNLGDYVRQDVICRKPFSCPKTNCDGRIKMTPRNVPDGIRHRQYGQTKRDGNTKISNGRSSQNRGAASAKDEPKRSDKLC